MASLLDVIVSRNNPQLGGLLGAQEGTSTSANALSPQPSPQQGGGGVGGVLGRIFGGQDDPRLSAQQNASARQQAMLQAGLATLASGGGGFGEPRGLQRLAQGALIGQQQGQRTRQQAVEARQEARQQALDEAEFLREIQAAEEEASEAQRLARGYSKVFGGEGGLTRQSVDEAIALALSNRDFDAASELRQLRSQFEDGKPVFKTFNRNGVSMTARIQEDGTPVDPITGKPLSRDMFRKMPAPRDPEEVQDRINALSDDARGDLQDANDVATAVRIGVDVPNTAAGATTLFTMLTRAIDPGVSVREADIARGEAATTLRGRALNVYNKWLEEGQLNERQYGLLKDELRRVGEAQQEQMQGLRRFWERRARDARVDPDLILPPDPFEGVIEDEEDEEEEAPVTGARQGVRDFSLTGN